MTSWPNIRELKNPRAFIQKLLKIDIVRYLIMAVVCVCFELGSFALMNIVLHITYVVATPLSMAVGITLNWIWSKKYVFQSGRHKSHIEFGLVLVASLIGAVIQLIVVSICVQHFHLAPILGKSVAIMITFFWNFWFRKSFVFHPKNHEINA